MPIRTHRGRAAVYRRLWGWPLRSPKHLAGAVLLLAGIAAGIGVVLPESPPRGEDVAYGEPAQYGGGNGTGTDGSGETTASGETTGSGATAREDTDSPPSISVPTDPPEPAPPDPAGLAVVREWGKRWVTHPPGTTTKQWLDRLRPYTTAEFITVMSTVDPANIPATKVTGPVEVDESTETSMRVRLPTNRGQLRIHVVRTSEGWRVAGYEKGA